ncbi:Gfo/Idh/MocA family oxidoreductase [Pontiellaceae bacterium B12227]|nr:Gfo/Idh/MocA family oxidoreductase [Pontiellaceae bacterium B12227]
MKKMNRRIFTAGSAAAAGFGISGEALARSRASELYRFNIGKPGPSANSKLNIAMIGASGIAGQAYGGSREDNVVALCDVDPNAFAWGAKKHPGCKTATQFSDFRVMLDKMSKEIDMVCVNTPDHTHFVATYWAMERGLHVFTQKPLVHDVWQARTLKRAKDKFKVRTNMGNQGHTFNGIRQLREWYEQGIFGQITEVHSFKDGPKWGGTYFKRPDSLPPNESGVPAGLNWDLWQGPTGPAPYHELYHPRTWRGFNRYGTGQFGDWFCHVADAPVWLLDLYNPVRVEAEMVAGGNEWMAVDGCRVRFDFERRGDKAPCSFHWWNGVGEEFRPGKPEDWSWPGSVGGGGTFYYGDKNNGFTDNRSNNPRLANKEAQIAFKAAGYPDEKYPRIKGGPIKELINCIKNGTEAGANFDYAAPMTEVMLLGVIAANHGGVLEWDAKKMKITNRPELNTYLRAPVRKGWECGDELWKA